MVWHEDEAFWAAVEPVLFTPERIAGTVADVAGALGLAGIQSPGKALDLCCGVGRASLELAGHGFAVTGVDRTQRYLERARREAAARALELEWVHDDMRRFRRDAAFDLAVSLFTSFGYFADDSEERAVIDNVFASLRPGGALVMELAGKEVIAKNFQARGWAESEGVLWLEERRIRPGWAWVDTRWIVVNGPTQLERPVSIRLYSAVEISALLSGAGFSSVEVFGSLQGAPYDLDAKRLVVLARKSG